MEVFVQSRGYSPDFEYCWQPEVPPQLGSISGLIQSESPSVVLARFGKRLMLLATGLDSLEKKDFRERPIRHSVCWMCSDNEHDEKQIRSIAVQALKGQLRDKVDKYINLDSDKGFKFVLSEFQYLSESLIKEIENQRLPKPEEPAKIGKDSQDLRDDLAYKLQQYSLPNNYELIVIATGIKAEDTLEKAGAWRSLSSLVKSEKWRKLSRSEVQQQPNFFRAAIAITVAVIAVVALILLVFPLHPFAPTPEVTPSSPQEISQNKPEVRINSEQVEQNSSITDSTSLENSSQSLEKDSTPSAK